MILDYSRWEKIYEEAGDFSFLTFNFCSHKIFPKSDQYLPQVFLKGVQEYFPNAKYESSNGSVYTIVIPTGAEGVDLEDSSLTIDFKEFHRSLIKYNGRTYPEPIVQHLRAITKKVIDPEFCNYSFTTASAISKDEVISEVVSKFQSDIKDVGEDLYYLILMKATGLFDEKDAMPIYFTLIKNGIAIDSIEKIRSLEIKENRIPFSELEKKARAEFPEIISELRAAGDRPNLDDSTKQAIAKRVAEFIYPIYQHTMYSPKSLSSTSQFNTLYLEFTSKLTDLITKAKLGKQVKDEMARLSQK